MKELLDFTFSMSPGHKIIILWQGDIENVKLCCKDMP